MNNFQNAYSILNDSQKVAVDQIEGPVLVVAGPGTGKTQLLSVRVGKILNSNIDIQPHNILCLTFTEAGAHAMRKRLLSYIGSGAYGVGIYTYHAFCNQVIQENPELFGQFRELKVLTDIEEVELFVKLFDNLPSDHELKRLKSQPYYYLHELKMLFSNMKKENWSIAFIEEQFQKQIELIDEDPEFHYKRKYKDKKPGDRNAKYFKKLEQFQRTLAGAKLLPIYNKYLAEAGRFDYNDMILWVLDKFSSEPDLLALYQERYQYIMLDEYQDTNGSQNELVFKLADYWEKPNLFAVGDDDQAIYRFQGARLSNVLEFKNKYDPTIIVLEDNYRSDQRILDASTSVISNNDSRLVNKVDALSKNLVEKRTVESINFYSPSIHKFQSEEQEETWIIKQIDSLNKSGIDYGDMAVLYRKHKNAESLIKYFSFHNIPVNLQRSVNVLELPFIRQLIHILSYVQEELKNPHSSERKLFEILHYPFMGLHPVEIAKVSVYCSRYTDDVKDDRKWRELLFDLSKLKSIGLKDPEKMHAVGSIIEKWIASATTETVQVLVEIIITSSSWLQSILNDRDKAWKLQSFNSFFNLIKEESDREEKMSLDHFLNVLTTMEDHNLSLSLNQVISSESGINFSTIHGSKGLEFKHVFMIKCREDLWDLGKKGKSLPYPGDLQPDSDITDLNDLRRLFFVGMTRAKDDLYISYSELDKNEKEKQPVPFIYEMEVDVPDKVEIVSEELISQYLSSIMTHLTGKGKLIDKDLLDYVLKDFKLSATALNKYLRCPLTFYFENILRVPMARTMNMGFGNAIHYALEYYFRNIDGHLPQGPLPEVTVLIDFFRKGMKKYHSHFNEREYQDLLIHGTNILSEYYQEYHHSWLLAEAYKLEHNIDNISCKGVPIKGKIDKLILRRDGVEVVDYKTGKYKSEHLKPPLGDDDNGGDYWRQLVFYKLLIKNDPKHGYNFRAGTMDWIEKDKDKFNRKTPEISALDEELVTNQLTDTYKKIHNHEFDGCQEENCKWCNFIANIESLGAPLYEGAEEED